MLMFTAGCLGPVSEPGDAGDAGAGDAGEALRLVFTCAGGNCCRDNSDCHTQAQACLGCGTDFYAPMGCGSDTECASGESCQLAPPGNGCTAGSSERRCARACHGDADCASPAQCREGFCWFAGCQRDADCPLDAACVLGGCRPALASCVSY
jgi:hypothetical protein